MTNNNQHACITLYNLAANGIKYGTKKGVCRVTGEVSEGIAFEKWVKDTFTNFDYLKPGTIISNEALFSFDESSNLIQTKTNRDKPQKFRTYSHVITKDGNWHVVTKADKEFIADLIKSDQVEILCLTDSGQKHLFFKHKNGFWQLDDLHVTPNVSEFTSLHSTMQILVGHGFGQEQIRTGRYSKPQILKIGLAIWQELETLISPFRGYPIFDLSAWLMFNDKKE